LPTFWEACGDETEYPVAINFKKYNSIFDAQDIGIYEFGRDFVHTCGKLEKGKKGWGAIDYTKYKIEWIDDDRGRRIPYMRRPENDGFVKINNLHVHSKQLHLAISRPLGGAGAARL
jgi:hypothetical protein